ncbi:MAG TPA: A24 family peptidase [Gemmatimonadales bacterium]|nr:A24 family peptidase [Gemmatimonadales bacterium]
MGGEPVLLVGAGALGLALGSFLNVCILRLAKEDKKQRSLFYPPSSCPHCGRRIAWRDNIPIVSWLLLRGRCRSCGQPISRQYPIIEAAVGILWLAAMLRYGPSVRFVAAGVLGTILVGIAVTDARHYLIPDEYNWTGLVIGLGLSLTGGVPEFMQAVLGACTGFVLLYAVGVAGRWVFKEEAMGGGDIKMMAMVGAFVGWKGVLLTVFAGSLFGSLVYVPLLVFGRRKRHVPFGVFLAMGAAVAFVFRDAIIDWYVRFLRAG